MNLNGDEQISKLVKTAIAPARETPLDLDLWPRIERRLKEPEIQVPWFDWVLVALVLILSLFMPQAVPGLFYNL